MSVEPVAARRNLSDVYPERKDGQWQTVANCLSELIDGEIAELHELANMALSLMEDGDALDAVVRRANRLNERYGKAGRAEAIRLARAAACLSAEGVGSVALAAHVARNGFNRKVREEAIELINAAMACTKRAIEDLGRNRTTYKKLADPVQASSVEEALAARDAHVAKELRRRDLSQALALAAVAGEANPWEAIGESVGPHTFPYPFRWELLVVQACLARLSDEGIHFRSLPEIPSELRTADDKNLPMLTAITHYQSEGTFPEYFSRDRVPLDGFARQICLEIIFLRQEATE